jgi:2-oxoglutarate dehydrogenase E1 component
VGNFFGSLHDDARALLEDLKGASWAPRDSRVIGGANGAGGNGYTAPVANASNGAALKGAPLSYGAPAEATVAPDQIRRATLDSIRALMLIRAYRVRGHLEANLDPLGLMKPEAHPELDPKSYGFAESDLDRPIFINYVLGLETATMRQIIDVVRATYCGNIGVEFMHIQGPEEKAWLQERIEGERNHTEFTDSAARKPSWAR